jgi:hypothetical protein
LENEGHSGARATASALLDMAQTCLPDGITPVLAMTHPRQLVLDRLDGLEKDLTFRLEGLRQVRTPAADAARSPRTNAARAAKLASIPLACLAAVAAVVCVVLMG